MKKTIALLLCVVMMSCLLVGCGKTATPAEIKNETETVEMEAAAELGDVELTLWTPRVFEVGYMEPLKELVAAYENANPNVTITIEELNWDGIAEKLESAMMTGSTPDIYIDGTARTAKLPSTGLVVDVTDVINSLDGWTSATEIGQIDGTNYLVPLTQMPPTTLAINVSLVKEYGCYDMLPKDRISWTWDEFMAFLEAVGEKSVADGVYPMSLFAGSQSSDITDYTAMMSCGAYVLNDDHTASAINTDGAVKCITYFKEIADKGLCYPGPASLTDEDVEGLFLNQKILVNTDWGTLNIIPVFEAMVEEGTISEIPEVETYAWPTLDGTQTVIGNWGANCMAIFENDNDSGKIAAAKDFLKYMMSDKEFSEALWAACPGYGPTRQFGQELKLTNENMIKEAEVYGQMSPYMTSDFGILEGYWGEIRQYFYPELQSVFLGNKTPADAIAAFETNVNTVLENNK